MTQLRWLLTMESLPEPDGDGRSYRLWLVPLDETDLYQPVPLQTVEELFSALFARWDHHVQPPADL